MLTAAFVAILFIQSGLDKILDWKGNLEWLRGHFSKTPLAPFVPIMLAKITILETLTGVLAAIGIVHFLVSGELIVIFAAGVLGALTILGLFFGQRIAKDYAGAAILVPYFIVMLILIVLSGPFARL
jgi:hypothetical protein